ncbi:hypothetical protein M0R45_020097 [Rubus argutus]|uniref:Uncharacterized protein n=1 Tax=Rubus argutus TaxID=59490 RepID=A0AAW1X906_RUBAR
MELSHHSRRLHSPHIGRTTSTTTSPFQFIASGLCPICLAVVEFTKPTRRKLSAVSSHCHQHSPATSATATLQSSPTSCVAVCSVASPRARSAQITISAQRCRFTPAVDPSRPVICSSPPSPMLPSPAVFRRISSDATNVYNHAPLPKIRRPRALPNCNRPA